MEELIAKQLVSYLEARGIEHIFGLCGHTNIAVLAALLHRRGLMQWDRRLKRAVPLMAGAGLVMGGVVWAADAWIYAPLAAQSLTRLLGLGVVVAAGLLSYGLTGQLIGAFNLRALRPGRWRNAAK